MSLIHGVILVLGILLLLMIVGAWLLLRAFMRTAKELSSHTQNDKMITDTVVSAKEDIDIAVGKLEKHISDIKESRDIYMDTLMRAARGEE